MWSSVNQVTYWGKSALLHHSALPHSRTALLLLQLCGVTRVWSLEKGLIQISLVSAEVSEFRKMSLDDNKSLTTEHEWSSL